MAAEFLSSPTAGPCPDAESTTLALPRLLAGQAQAEAAAAHLAPRLFAQAADTDVMDAFPTQDHELILPKLFHLTYSQPLFSTYPVRSNTFIASLGSTLVVAPHPDDEALGCGELLALLRQVGQPVATALASDGTMSHPASQLFPPSARRAVREAEFRHALTILGVENTEPLLLGLPDSQVPATISDASFTEAVAQLRAFLDDQQPATVLVPWRRDPHPDHRATSYWLQAALAAMPHPPRRLEYVVWAWERVTPADLPNVADKVSGFRLDVRAVAAQKQQAIAAHHSQVAPGIFTDDEDGFLLSEKMLEHITGPYEVFFAALAP
ncbi:PIG-L deacetylase family protein [Hymenobacter terrenus]|uniref:PIG-L deacetylase family protein n=1 Tax=Hymenobacter terrenus TaxID=1629124 RepID=UPI0009E4F1C0|nr:PIG-L family deacetylase [Hymenobacter terrenus]